MYSNGYVPPRPAQERKRRSDRSGTAANVQSTTDAAHARAERASSRQDWRQQAASAPNPQRPAGGTAYSETRQTTPYAHRSSGGQDHRQAGGAAYPETRQTTPYAHRSSNGRDDRQAGGAAYPDARQTSWQQPGASSTYPQQGGYQPGYGSAPQHRSGNTGYAGQQPNGYGMTQNGYGMPMQGQSSSAPMGGYATQDRPMYPPQYPQQGSPAAGPYYPPQGQGIPPMPPQDGWYGGGSNPPPRKPKKKRHTLVIALVALVLVAGASVGGAYGLKVYQTQQYVEPYTQVFCPGVYVDGISLGGMTMEQGVAAVTGLAQERNDAWSVRLTYQGQQVTEITAGQLGMTVDVTDVLRLAWEKGHTGDIYERKAAMEQLLVEPFQAYTAMPSGDTSVVDGILQDIKNSIYKAPVDAALTEFNPENTYPFSFTEEQQGRILDTEPIKAQLYQMVSTMTSGDVEIVPDTIEPTVTVAQLKEHLTERTSVYTPIDKHSTEERTNNIRRCFQLISGKVLEAGSKFSFNGVVGQRTVKNGFYEAIEYAYGDLVMGVGGGACQASTTLYQAAVESGLEIIDRTPHSDSVSYAAYGEDATVYWNGDRKIDLVFRNDTSNPIYIVAAVQSDPSNKSRLIAKVTIYGDSLGSNVRYELQSQTVKTLTAPETPEYIKDKKATYVTYTDEEQQVRNAKDGCVVESYRIKYVDNLAMERILLFTDTYEAKAARIYVGVTKRPTD